MASIERTAYPRLKQKFSKSELHDFYTPSWEEIFFVRETARNARAATTSSGSIEDVSTARLFSKS